MEDKAAHVKPPTCPPAQVKPHPCPPAQVKPKPLPCVQKCYKYKSSEALCKTADLVSTVGLWLGLAGAADHISTSEKGWFTEYKADEERALAFTGFGLTVGAAVLKAVVC